MLRTVSYTTARVWAFCYFYDKVNPDSRRLARPDYLVAAGLTGGFIAGLITNPVEVVFTRMQADEMYPVQARRNYKHFLDGLMKVSEEGALMRGAVPNGLRIGALCASMTSIFDLCKENSYYFLGPSWINRLWSTIVAVTIGTGVSMPFDCLRTRLYTMRPLPTGEMPYSGTFDCLVKILKYECNFEKSSNPQSLYAGLEAYWLRLFIICYASQFLLDHYHSNAYVSEFWQPARFHYQGGIDYDIHDPYTDAFNKRLVATNLGKRGLAAAHPDGKDQMVMV
ncbi:MAG: MC/SLC25 family protein [Candidatus Roizmanbacteria bacterium]